MNTRNVYVKRSVFYQDGKSCGAEVKWIQVPFMDINIHEEFILCEKDGTPVCHAIAISDAREENGIGVIDQIEIGIVR